MASERDLRAHERLALVFVGLIVLGAGSGLVSSGAPTILGIVLSVFASAIVLGALGVLEVLMAIWYRAKRARRSSGPDSRS